MALFANIFAVLVGFIFATSGASFHEPSESKYGVDKAATAYEAVCWYEFLKKFPPSGPHVPPCFGAARKVAEEAITNQLIKSKERAIVYGSWVKRKLMTKLPEEYEACKELLLEVDAKPETDESYVMNDRKKKYPLKAFAYCLMSKLRELNGNKVIMPVKAEVIFRSKKDWKQTFLARENKARTRHNVKPLKMVDELHESAQNWAEQNALDCRSYHSHVQDRKYEGDMRAGTWKFKGYTGENLMALSTGTEMGPAGYLSANSWYGEVNLYPYPDGFTGQGTEPLFPKIGHFTQMVWKETKYVGYGYAQNNKCKGENNTFVVAHYYPIGNTIGDFKKNVNPPKK